MFIYVYICIMSLVVIYTCICAPIALRTHLDEVSDSGLEVPFAQELLRVALVDAGHCIYW